MPKQKPLPTVISVYRETRIDLSAALAELKSRDFPAGPRKALTALYEGLQRGDLGTALKVVSKMSKGTREMIREDAWDLLWNAAHGETYYLGLAAKAGELRAQLDDAEAPHGKGAKLPRDPEAFRLKDSLLFTQRELARVDKENLKAREAVGRLLRRAGEPITPLSWKFLLPLLSIHLKAKKKSPA